MSRHPIILSLALPLLLPLAVQAQQRTFLGKNSYAWRKLLSAADDTTRRNAAFALGKLQKSSVVHASALVDRLQNDESPMVREASAFALGEICKSAPHLGEAPKLVMALRRKLDGDDNDLVRRSCAFAIGCLNGGTVAALPELKRAVAHPNPSVRQNAVWALRNTGVKGVKTLNNAIKNEKNPLVLRDAAGSLGKIGRAAADASDDLADHLSNQNVEVRKAVAAALVAMVNRNYSGAGPRLAVALKDPIVEVRQNAAFALGNIGGTSAKPAIPVLIKTLKNAKLPVRRQAAVVLGNVGPLAAKAAPILLEAIQSKDAELRRNAAYSLGGIRAVPEKAIPVLSGIVGNSREQPSVRQAGAFAMLEFAQDAIREPNPTPIQKAAVKVLRKHIGPRIKVIGDNKQPDNVRAATLLSLFPHGADLEGHQTTLYPALEKIVGVEQRKNNNWHRTLRYSSAVVLGVLQGPTTGKPTMDVLQEFLSDDKVGQRKRDEGIGGKTGEPGVGPSDIKPVAIGDGRAMAVRALRAIGPKRVAARRIIVQQLRRLSKDRFTNELLRKECAALLKEFKL